MNNSNNILSNYVKYNNLLLNDGTNKKETVNLKTDCINKCSNNPNCQGVNIITNNVQNQVNTDGYNYQNVPQITCQYVSNICYSNTKNENANSTLYAKKNNSHLENNVPYLLKNNNVCLSTKNNNLGATNCNDINNVTPVLVNTDSNIIKVGMKGDICLNYDNNGNLNLDKCNTFNPNHKFIYENVYNTLRPYNDSSQCVNTTKITNNGNTNYKYITVPCTQSSSQNNVTFENYHNTIADNIEHFQNKDYSTDMMYYVIYITLLCMIAFLVIISSK